MLAGKYDVTMEIEILKNGAPFNDSSQTGTNPAIQLGTLPQKRFTIQGFFPGAEFEFQGFVNDVLVFHGSMIGVPISRT